MRYHVDAAFAVGHTVDQRVPVTVATTVTAAPRASDVLRVELVVAAVRMFTPAHAGVIVPLVVVCAGVASLVGAGVAVPLEVVPLRLKTPVAPYTYVTPYRERTERPLIALIRYHDDPALAVGQFAVHRPPVTVAVTVTVDPEEIRDSIAADSVAPDRTFTGLQAGVMVAVAAETWLTAPRLVIRVAMSTTTIRTRCGANAEMERDDRKTGLLCANLRSRSEGVPSTTRRDYPDPTQRDHWTCGRAGQTDPLPRRQPASFL